MFNLIPQHAKKQLRHTYWSRVFAVWFVTWSIMLWVGMVALLPPLVLIGGQVASYEGLEAEESTQSDNYESIKDALMKANLQANLIRRETGADSVSNYITLINDLAGESIEVTAVGVYKEGTRIGAIQVTGKADDRTSLSAFRDRLVEEETIEAVDLPIANLAQDKDIEFSLQVKMTATPK